jgi:hypothetical protein
LPIQRVQQFANARARTRIRRVLRQWINVGHGWAARTSGTSVTLCRAGFRTRWKADFLTSYATPDPDAAQYQLVETRVGAFDSSCAEALRIVGRPVGRRFTEGHAEAARLRQWINLGHGWAAWGRLDQVGVAVWPSGRGVDKTNATNTNSPPRRKGRQEKEIIGISTQQNQTKRDRVEGSMRSDRAPPVLNSGTSRHSWRSSRVCGEDENDSIRQQEALFLDGHFAAAGEFGAGVGLHPEPGDQHFRRRDLGRRDAFRRQ